MTFTLRPFHLAFPVHDLNAARHFYGEVLGCNEGRHSDHWIDFDFFGHQIVAHLDDTKSGSNSEDALSNPVDGEQVPVPHFGIILTPGNWSALAERVTAAGIEYIIKPTIRFEGQSGEQSTMFFRDPSGNALEFKAFGNDAMIFAAGA